MKWTTTVAFDFIEESILNSFYLFDKVVAGQRLLQFKLNLINELLDTSVDNTPEYNLPAVGRHFLEVISPTEKKKNPQKRCSVCFRKK